MDWLIVFDTKLRNKILKWKSSKLNAIYVWNFHYIMYISNFVDFLSLSLNFLLYLSSWRLTLNIIFVETVRCDCYKYIMTWKYSDVNITFILSNKSQWICIVCWIFNKQNNKILLFALVLWILTDHLTLLYTLHIY